MIIAARYGSEDNTVVTTVEDEQGRWFDKVWDVESPAFNSTFTDVEFERIFRLAEEDQWRITTVSHWVK